MDTPDTPNQESPSKGLNRFQKVGKTVVSLLGSVEVITQRRNEVLKRWEDFRTLAGERRAKLEDSRKLQQYNRDVDELQNWIAEKMQTATDQCYADPTNLQGKIKKHQAFESEILANEDAFTAVRNTATKLKDEEHYATASILETLEKLEEQWKELKEQTKDKTQKLYEAQQLLTFKRETGEVRSWIDGKVAIASSDDTGKDLEHVEMLQKRFEDFANDLLASESRIEGLAEAAAKLVEEQHPEQEAISSELKNIQEAWVELKELTAKRKINLANARETHLFNRDADEILGRIAEKAMMLSSEEYGKDLASVEALQRKHEGFTRDLVALADGVADLGSEANRLCDKFPDDVEEIRPRQDDVDKSWEELQTKASERKDKLDASYSLQRFLSGYRNSIHWINDMKALINTEELAKDVAGADAMAQKHQEYHGEIAAREDSFQTTIEFGESLLSKSHYASDEIEGHLTTLRGEIEQLKQLWADRKKQVDQCNDLQLFLRDAEHVDAWISSQETSLATEDLGDSLDSVDALIKKHDDFEKSLVAQEEKTKALQDASTRLLGSDHYDADTVSKRWEEVSTRRKALDELAASRLARLEASRKLQQFLRDADEAEAWMMEKLQTATDEAYRDPTNLRGKLQNHQAFEAELVANQGRIDAVNQSGEALLESDHYASKDVSERLAALNEQWKYLRDQSTDKGQKLKEANQQQQFTRRVEDINAWCAEVETTLSSEETGKDLTAVQNLLKKHQLLEAEVAAHAERISEVTSQAETFISEGNFQADEIKTKRDGLVARYDALKQPIVTRRQRLEDSMKLQQYFRDADDELSWIKEKEPAASSANYGTSLTAVQNLQKKHVALLAELSGREKAVNQVTEVADKLTADGHYASEEIKARRESLTNAWKGLNSSASDRKTALDEALQCQQYLADANEAQAWMTEKEPIVSNDDYGKDEDSALALLKKHEAFEADLKTYQGTIDTLKSESAKCKDTPLSAIDLGRVSPGRKSSPMLSPRSKRNTAETSHVAAFKYKARRDSEVDLVKGEQVTVVDKDNADWWKISKAGGNVSGYVPAAYVKEVAIPNSPENKKPGTPTQFSRSSSTEALNLKVMEPITEKQKKIQNHYESLLQQAEKRRNRLEESQKLYQLNREIDEVESWMKDCEAIATAQDLGNDLEHNEIIQKKFEDFSKDLSANDARITAVNELAQKFLSQGHTDSEIIKGKQDALNARWDELQNLAEVRSKALSDAHEIHRFNRDVDETKIRFNEKQVVLALDDYGKDVASVEALQRKHESAMRDLAALETKVKELHNEATRLQTDHPQETEKVKAKEGEIDQSWSHLQSLAQERKTKLDDSLALQQFLDDFRDLNSWLGSMQALASSTELAKDASGAQALLKRHTDLRSEIDARGENIQNLKSFGESLKSRGHYASDEVGEKLEQLETQMQVLDQNMAERKTKLDQCSELQTFTRIAEQADAWIGTRQAPLTADDVGTTLDAVESMQKKHADFEKSLVAQTEKIKEIESEAARLVNNGHYAADEITERKAGVAEKWEDLLKLSDTRKAKLADALRVQQFHRDADEVEAWLNEKQQTAMDPSYTDPTNLQGKMQKHQGFEAEVVANKDRIFSVIQAGNQLLDQCPEEKDAIEGRIRNLEKQWEELHEQSQDKAQKLREANEQQQFNHGVEDLELWLSELEVLLSSKDEGKDLPGVQNLLKKHQLNESDIAAKQDRIDSVNKQAEDFIKNNHFDSKSIQAKQASINDRYDSLKERSALRRTQLERSLELQQTFRDIDDEDAWLKEKERIASSTDFGKDLTGVQNLQKKHQTFDSELSGHEGRISAVLDGAQRLLDSGNYDEDLIEERKTQLENRWANVKRFSNARRAKLNESLEYQLFNADIDEEESWVNEKQSMVSSEDQPDTLSSAQALVKKHDAFEADLGEHKDRINAVCEQGNALIQKNNYQEPLIKESCQKLNDMMANLEKTASSRKEALQHRFELLQFSREADSIEAWIEDKQPQATSGEFGKDLPSVQSLLAKHDTFEASLMAFQPRIAAFAEQETQLLSGGNRNGEQISKRQSEVAKAWSHLKGCCTDRKSNLLRSQQRFQNVEDLFLEFAQKASQFNSWFENAEEDLTDPVRVNSIDEILALRDSHAQFMASLSSARQRFEELERLDSEIRSLNMSKNPYTWFTIDTLRESWQNLQQIIQDRDNDLTKEQSRQENNEELRKKFAKHANEFSAWLAQTRSALVEGSGTLEAQLEATKAKYDEILTKKRALKQIEDLGANMEEALILDNKYTEHSTVGLAQQWDQLEQLGMRMQHNLEQQIQAKNTTGVSEEQLKEFNETFRYFDKDRSGRLDHQELKSCLRSLGYSFPVMEPGEIDPEFQAILSQVDPDGDGYVTLAEFMSFMISRETENVESASEVTNAFKAAAGDKPYVTADELRKALTPEQADYCIRYMKPYIDNNGIEIQGGYDYRGFTQALFISG